MRSAESRGGSTERKKLSKKEEELESLINLLLRIQNIIGNGKSAKLDSLFLAQRQSIDQLKKYQESGVDAVTLRKMVAGMRQGIREMPELIRSMRDIDGLALARLVESEVGVDLHKV